MIIYILWLKFKQIFLIKGLKKDNGLDIFEMITNNKIDQ